MYHLGRLKTTVLLSLLLWKSWSGFPEKFPSSQKLKVPKSLWCGGPHQQRDNTDLKLCSLFGDDHLSMARRMKHLIEGQLCHQSQRHLLCFMWQWTDPLDSSASIPSCNSLRSHPPICGHKKRQSGRERFIFFLWESCLKCKLIDLHGFAYVTWRISRVSYISNHKLMPWCLDHLVPLTLKDRYDLERIWFIFNVDGIQNSLNILTPNNWCGKRKRCDWVLND